MHQAGIVDGMTMVQGARYRCVFLEEFLQRKRPAFVREFHGLFEAGSVGLPTFELSPMHSPCPYTLLGRIRGEGGAIGSLAAVANAVEDALAPFGVRFDLYHNPERSLGPLKK